MQKNYKVSVDITVSKNVYVKAENEELAKTIAKNLVADDPFYYAKTAESFLEAVSLEAQETEEEEDDWKVTGGLYDLPPIYFI